MTAVSNFAKEYNELLWTILQSPHQEVNRRTGVAIRTTEGAWSFKLNLDGALPVPSNRRYFPRVAAVETAWEVMGTRDPEFVLNRAPKIWQDFVEDGEIKCAYGYRWREHFGRDQLALAARALSNNPSDRQVYVSAWDPARDGLGEPNQPKNVPCPVGFSLTRTRDATHMSVFVRSSDVFVGLPYDVMGYALKLDALATTLRCKAGTLHFTLAHPHIYEPHFTIARESLAGQQHHPFVPLPQWSLRTIEDYPSEYVERVRELSEACAGHEFSPFAQVVV